MFSNKLPLYIVELNTPLFSKQLSMMLGADYDEEWIKAEGLLKERYINQVKLAYAYSKQKLTVQTEASFYNVEDGENFSELGASKGS